MANNHISVGQNNRGQELRNAITQGVAFRNALRQLKGSMGQYGADSAGYTAIEADFNLPAGLGSVLVSLLGSAADEAEGLVTGTFIAQLLDRAG